MTGLKAHDAGKLLLRLLVGGLLLLHGINKLRHGIDWMKPELAAKGLPGWFRFGNYLGEVVGPLLVLAGWWTRVGGGLIAVNMVFAVYLSHMHDIGKLNRAGGWQIELDVFYFVGALVIVLLGSGTYALSRGRGRLD